MSEQIKIFRDGFVMRSKRVNRFIKQNVKGTFRYAVSFLHILFVHIMEPSHMEQIKEDVIKWSNVTPWFWGECSIGWLGRRLVAEVGMYGRQLDIKGDL